MLRGILPKEYAFYDYFERLMQINTTISEEFVAIAEGKVTLENASRTIKYHERESDKISHDCIDLLHRTFITPIDRDQIYELIKGLDDFADQIDAATFRLTYYDIEEIRPDTLEFAKVIHAANLELDLAIKGLRKIKKSRIIREKCFKVHELENQSDEILRKAIGSLFKENNVHLIIKWKEIFERLEKAVDRQEKVANTIESILIDNA
jgi:uncharacterized protein Yka (UPF0111/DUF47 family)